MFPGISSENSRKPADALGVSVRSFVEVNLLWNAEERLRNGIEFMMKRVPRQVNSTRVPNPAGSSTCASERSILPARSAKMICFEKEERN